MVAAVTPLRSAAPRRGRALIRVSWERDGTTSPEIQRHAIEEYAARENITLSDDDWIICADDHDFSASRNDSKWWDVLDDEIALIESGQRDVLVFWKMHRTSRNRLKWALALDRIDNSAGSMEFATEPIDVTTTAGRFGRDVMVAANVMQAEMIGDAWRETHERRRRHGLPPTGGHRFGYQAVIEERPGGRHTTVRYEIDPETGPILTEMYRRYLGGAGSAQITRWLNDAGVPAAASGSRWTYQQVLKVLDAGFGAGVLSRTRVKVAGKWTAVPCWEREYLPGAQEPVIDGATWDAYRAARAERTRQPVHSPEKYLLTGLLRCTDCRGRMHGHSARTSGRDYRCSSAYATNGMRKVTIRTTIVERAVEKWVLGLAADVNARAEAEQKTQKKAVRTSFTVRSLEKRIARATERITALTIRLADKKGLISDDAYHAAVAVLEADRREANAQLKKLAPNPVRQSAPQALPADLARLWPRMTNVQKADVLRPLIARIEISPVGRVGNVDTTGRVRIIPAWEPDSEE